MTIKTVYFFKGIKKILSLLMVGIAIFLFSGANVQGQSNVPFQFDRDNDKLIEIRYIEDLDNIRLNLTGACGASGCIGYELARSLDFNNVNSYRSRIVNTSYTTGSGWTPIGNSINLFNTIFEGNGYVIDNLYINRPSTDHIGLFGYISNSSRIRNIGVTNVSVLGNSIVGGLVGENRGIISQSYATGNMIRGSNNYVGGLLGINSAGTITQSYANVSSVAGITDVGGLVGWNNSGRITQTYAAGNVTGNVTGNAIGTIRVGGLVGNNEYGTIIHGYWNTDASQIEGGVARTTVYKKGIGATLAATEIRVTGLAINQLRYPNSSPTDAILELGPGFTYRQDQLPITNLGAKLTFTLSGVVHAFTQVTPTATSWSLAQVLHAEQALIGSDGWSVNGTATTRAQITVKTHRFQADLIGLTDIQSLATITRNGVKMPQTILLPVFDTKRYGDLSFPLPVISTARLALFSVASNNLVSIDNNHWVTINGAGIVSITAYHPGNADYFPDSATQILIIKGTQIITFGALAQKTFGEAPFVLNASSSVGLTVSYSTSSNLVSINNNNVTINGAGTVNITAFQLGNNNYVSANPVIQILTINKARQSISFGTLVQKTFGDAPFDLDASSSVGLTVSYAASPNLVSTIDNGVIINGVGTVNIIAFQTGNANYLEADSVVRILTINKSDQSISFGSLAQKTFGNAPFVLSAISSGGLSVSYFASNTLVNVIGSNVVIIKGVGTVNITAFQTGNANYVSADVVVQILTINKSRQSISFGTLAQKTFGDAPFVLGAISSGGLTVSYSASSTLVSINNNNVAINGAGTVSIIAFQTGGNNYLRADSVVRILTINKARQSISFGTLAQKTFGDAPFVLSASSSGGLTVSFSASSNLVSININTITINGAGTVSITAFQIGNENYVSADVVVQILTIDKSNQSISFGALAQKTFGDASFALDAISSGGLSVSYSASNTFVSIVGSVVVIKGVGMVNITAFQTGNANYLPASATQILTIAERNDPSKITPIFIFATIPNLTIGQKYKLVASSNSTVAITFTSADTNKLSIVGNTATAKASGNVTIIANQAGNAEYNPAASAQNITITDPTLLVATISFTAIPNLNIGQKYTLVASSNSPVAIIFTSSDTNKLSIVGNAATAKTRGNLTITASQAGNAQFNATTSVQNVTVLDPNLPTAAIHFAAIPNLTVGNKYTLVTTSNSPVAITFVSVDEKIATVSGNTLTAVGSGTTVITAIQAGNAEFNAATVQQTVIVVNETVTTPPLTFVETHNTSIRIFPNPANDYITIQYDKTQKVSSVKVYDMTGKSYELKMNHDKLGMKADIKNLPKGEYILVIYGERGEVLKTELLVKKL